MHILTENKSLKMGLQFFGCVLGKKHLYHFDNLNSYFVKFYPFFNKQTHLLLHYYQTAVVFSLPTPGCATSPSCDEQVRGQGSAQQRGESVLFQSNLEFPFWHPADKNNFIF